MGGPTAILCTATSKHIPALPGPHQSALAHVAMCTVCCLACGRASEEDYSDDEDLSWKVRRAAAKTVSAVITHYPHLLAEVRPALLAC